MQSYVSLYYSVVEIIVSDGNIGKDLLSKKMSNKLIKV